MPDVAPLLNTDPAQVAGYRLTGRIGAGGQGVVYLGVTPDNELVAVKMLRVEDEHSRQLFTREVSAARRVAPFCTAQIIDFDMAASSPYVVSEYIEGPSLHQYVSERGTLTGTRLQRLAIGTATALAAIHQAGVVHRDLKPANVMMSPEGPRVIDFGIARDDSNDTTKVSKLLGTPAFMSPEQLRGERVGPATDMFAWGSVMVFAATGRAPFEAEHMMAAIAKIANDEPDLTGVPPELAGVLRLCFSKDPARRPSAQQALSMLLGRPSEPDTTDATVVLAEATQLVVASSTGPAGGYSGDARATVGQPVAAVDETRVERPVGSTGNTGPGVTSGSGEVPAWGTQVPEGQPQYPAQPQPSRQYPSQQQWQQAPQPWQRNGPAGRPDQPPQQGQFAQQQPPFNQQAPYGGPGQFHQPGPTAAQQGWNRNPPVPGRPQNPQQGWGSTPAQPVGPPPQNWNAPANPQPGWGGSGAAPNRGRTGVLVALASLVCLVAGFAIWGAVADDGTGTGTNGSSTSSSGSKDAADPDACGGRINVGADQGDDSDCTSADSGTGTSSGSSDETTSSDESSTDAGDSGIQTPDGSDEPAYQLAPSGTLPYALDGVWEGQVSQPAASVDSWTVRLDLTAAKKRPGTMKVVDLDCVSNLTVENAGFTTATLQAPVKDKDDPHDACAELGEVILIANTDGTVGFTWQDQNSVSNVGLATLEKVG
ncbi:protein kinase [Kineosporia sp. J2-2]|uniref:non-specific serine/threonine protein kinase n=1 Tax=Kineosporia corallincola TaxID=2835133 RepID=A0ABS5TSJ8_9ACTN|nr:serine/threonine-protein kinase [Kineosporia corallincola]MBT0773793.1 protein kinase [Kineosporia corallincola]